VGEVVDALPTKDARVRNGRKAAALLGRAGLVRATADVLLPVLLQFLSGRDKEAAPVHATLKHSSQWRHVTLGVQVQGLRTF